MIGTVLDGRYEILALVSEGPGTTVYSARHRLMNRLVAVKVLHAGLSENAAILRRFKEEAKAVSALEHPNIVAVYDFGVSEGGEPYLVMDNLPGESLAQVIAREKRLPAQRVRNIMKQCCLALSHAHQKGVIHRGLGPGIIMLAEQDGVPDFVKIVDFGIAKILKPAGTQTQRQSSSGGACGAPQYMSPEQCMGRQLDGRSDIYAVGCIAYEALAGRPPFQGETVLEVASQHVNQEPLRFNLLDSGLSVPAHLESTVLKALAKKPELRFHNMEEMAAAFESGAETGAVSATRADGGQSKKTAGTGISETLRKNLLRLASLALVLLAVLVALSWWLRTESGSLAAARLTLAWTELVAGNDAGRMERALTVVAERYERQADRLAAAEHYERLILLDGQHMSADSARLVELKGKTAILFAQSGDQQRARTWSKEALSALENEGRQALRKKDLAAIARAYARVAEILENTTSTYSPELDAAYERMVIFGDSPVAAGDRSYWQKKELALRLRAFGADDARVGESLCWLGSSYRKEHKVAEATAVLESARRIAKRFPNLDYAHVVLYSLSDCYWESGDKTKSIRLLREAIDNTKGDFQQEPVELGTLEASLADKYMELNKWQESASAYDEAISQVVRLQPPQYEWLCTLCKSAAQVDGRCNRLDLIEKNYRQMLKGAVDGKLIDRQVDALIGLGDLYRQTHKDAQAEIYDRQAVKTMKANGKDKETRYLAELQNCGYDLVAQKKWEEARTCFKTAFEAGSGILSSNDRFFVLCKHYLSFVQFQLGQYQEAELSAQQSLSLSERVKPPDKLLRAQQLLRAVYPLLAEKKYEQAESYIKRALAVPFDSSGQPTRIEIMRAYGSLLRQTGRADQAAKLEQEAGQLEKVLARRK